MRVVTALRGQIAARVALRHPDLPPWRRRQIIQKEFDTTLKSQGRRAREAIEHLARKLDRRRPRRRKAPYLLASDSYYYYDLTRRLLETGRLGEAVEGSKYLNGMMLAPLGHWEPLNLHPYVGAALFRLLHLLQPQIGLMEAVGWTPLIVALACLGPFFLLCGLLGLGRGAALAGGVVLMTAPIFVKRSMWGWYDNDPYSVLFTLGVMAFVVAGILKADIPRRLFTVAVGLGLWICLYSLFWQGWMYAATLAAAAWFLAGLIGAERSLRRGLPSAAGILALAILGGIGILLGPRETFILFREGLTALRDFLDTGIGPWPDVYLGVGELRPAAFGQIMDLTGGPWVILLSGIGALGLLDLRKKETRRRGLAVSAVLLFGIAALILSRGAQRFLLLLVPPTAVLSALGMERLLRSIVRRLAGRGRPLIPDLVSWGLVLALAVGSTARTGRRVPALLDPIFNEVWEESLSVIRERTPPETVVAGWWPPGHFIKAVARRRVVFDGATIETPQAYWMARILLSPDERTALGLLRMLTVSGNRAVEDLLDLGWNLDEAVRTIEAVAPLSRAAADRYLQERLPAEARRRFLEDTHGEPPPVVLLLYNTLIDNNLQLAFVGRWDFAKAAAYRSDPRLRKRLRGGGHKDRIRVLWEIAGGRPRFSGVFTALGRKGDLLFFPHGILIDEKHMTCRIDSPTYGRGTPRSLITLDAHGRLREIRLEGARLPYSVLLYKDRGRARCILLDGWLGRSLLLRLWCFHGKGLRAVRPLAEHSDLTGQTRIQSYMVDWEAFSKWIGEETPPTEKVEGRGADQPKNLSPTAQFSPATSSMTR